MASDIDELLIWMRREEAASRDAPNRVRSADMLALFAKDAVLFARWIAAVEELVAFKADHTGGLVVDPVCQIEAHAK